MELWYPLLRGALSTSAPECWLLMAHSWAPPAALPFAEGNLLAQGSASSLRAAHIQCLIDVMMWSDPLASIRDSSEKPYSSGAPVELTS